MIATRDRANLNFFDEGSPFLQHPLLTAARTRREVDLLVEHLDLTEPTRILDVGCGFGRHSIELARLGHAVTGIDPAPAMIEAAKKRAHEAGVAADWRVGDGRFFQAALPFAVVLCLFTTLGQHDERGENTDMLANLFALVQPEGHLVLEAPQRDVAVRMLVGHRRFNHSDGYTEVRRYYDATDHSVDESFEVVNLSSHQLYRLRYRLYSGEELTELAQEAGFRVCETFGDFGGTSLRNDSPTMLFFCQR